MKKINQFKVFIMVAVVVIILGIITITMRMDTNNVVVKMLNDGISVTQNAIVSVVHGIRNFGQSTFDLFTTHEENQRLRSQMYQVELMDIQLALAEEENQRLRQMLEVDDTLDDFERISAVTIGRDINSWHDFFTVNQGRYHGVELGMAVVSLEGFVIGRITEVNQFSSRVHLMKPDNTSIRTQVEVLDTPRSHGILHGYDSALGELVVRQVPNDVEIEIGSSVITTGLGGIFPRGLLAGHVTRIEMSTDGLTQNIFLSNEVQYDDLRFVFIIKRAMPDIEEDDLEFEVENGDPNPSVTEVSEE